MSEEGTERPVRLGVVGAGGFAAFVSRVVGSLPDLQLVSVLDQNPERSARFAEENGTGVASTLEDLLAVVDAVLITTPPSSHAPQVLAAFAAGRHVFCEKPLALTPADAGAILAAQPPGTALVVDHVIRYNPLVRLLSRLRSGGVLGDVQRFSFENDAGDSALGPDHWFWDPAVSGGILLEHGVHFFDAASMLVGDPGTVVNALAAERPDGRVDTVVATVRHRNGALATHSHGFSHPNHAERQLMRVDFGLAEARLEGWIPLSLDLRAWTDDAGLAALTAVADDPASALDLPGYRPHPRQRAALSVRDAPAWAISRDRTHRAPHEVALRVELGGAEDKPEVYAESVRAALTDFLTSIRSGAVPAAGAREGADAVVVAAAATRALGSGRAEPVSAAEARPLPG
jgi:predicted dehydrogenase